MDRQREEPTYVEKVANKIIEQLEQGTAPWQRPWKPGELQRPFNPTTNKPYRGGNALWLMMQGEGDPRWMTYKQAAEQGAQVRRGEKGTVIQYAKYTGEEPVVDAQGKPVIGEDGKPLKETVQYERPKVFHAVVFNASQIDGLPPLAAKTELPEWERHAQAEAILAASPVPIHHVAGNRAYYSPSRDHIVMPERAQFENADGYYATALHELGHATGHPSRLNRDLAHPFGSEGYAKEELRAEIASLMMGERLEIGHDPGQHVAYVGSWIKALRDDPREIFRAAADAEKIADYVQGLAHRQDQHLDNAAALELAERTLERYDSNTLTAAEFDAINARLESQTQVDAPTSVREMLLRDVEAAYDRVVVQPEATAQERAPDHLRSNPRFAGNDDAREAHTAGRFPDDGPTDYAVLAEKVAAMQPAARFGVDPPPGQWSGEVLADTEWSFAAARLDAPDQVHYVPNADFQRIPASGDRIVVDPRVAEAPATVELLTEWQQRNGLTPLATPEKTAAVDEQRHERAELGLPAAARAEPQFLLLFGDGKTAPQTFQTAEDAAQAFAGADVAQRPSVATNADHGGVRFVAQTKATTVDGQERLTKSVSTSLRDDGFRSAFESARNAQEEQAKQAAAAPLNRGEQLAKAIQNDAQRVIERFMPEHQGLAKPALQEAAVATVMGQFEHAAKKLDQVAAIAAGYGDNSIGELARTATSLHEAKQARAVAGTRSEPGVLAAATALPVAAPRSNAPASPEAPQPATPNRADQLIKALNGPAAAVVAGFSATDQATAKAALQEATVATVLRKFDHAAKKLEAVATLAAGYGDTSIAGLARDAQTLAARYPEPQALKTPVQTESATMANKDADRKYLAVPFKEKDQAKAAAEAAGFRIEWDKNAKAWHAPANADLTALAKWLPENRAVAPVAKQAPEQEFADVLKRAGFNLPSAEPVMDGTMQRVPVDGDRGNERSGAYKAFLDGHPAGFFQNFRTGEKGNWKASQPSERLSDEDRARLAQEAAAKLAARAAERTAGHEAVAARLATELKDPTQFTAADPQHPYLQAKGLAGDAGGLLQDRDGNLVVAAHDATGKVWTVQRIDAQGRKGFEKEGQVEGHFALLKGTDQAKDAPIVIAEGWATAETIRRATGADVVVAFNSGNLPAVAKTIREQNPDRPIVIAGDNDHRKEREVDPRTGQPKPNVGKLKALEAAKTVNGYAALPPFASSSKGSDWNDYAREQGNEQLKQAMTESMVLADRRRLADAQSTEHDAERVAEVVKLNQAKAEQSRAPNALDQRAAYSQLRQKAGEERDKQDKADEAPEEIERQRARQRSGGRSRSR